MGKKGEGQKDCQTLMEKVLYTESISSIKNIDVKETAQIIPWSWILEAFWIKVSKACLS